MIQKNKKDRVMPEEQYGPRIAGEILREYLEKSNDPLAVAYRERIAESEEDDDEDQLFKSLFPNTELDSILKLLTRKPGRLSIGERIVGSITRDGENHYTFLEDAFKRKKETVHRNPIYLRGTFINVHVMDDGSFYPTFNRPRFNENFTCQDFFRGASSELTYFASLLENKSERV